MRKTLIIHNTNIKNLNQLIELYINTVNELSKKLTDCLKVNNLCDRGERRERKIFLKGECNKYSLKYYFHGIGCHIETTTIEIDFDFGDNCSLGGFDIWRLWCFISDNNLSKKFNIFKDKVFLEKILLELEKNNQIVKCKELYYLSSPILHIQPSKLK
jgi:hypothetical protein